MSGPVIRNPVPEWLRRENESVLDSPYEKAIKMLARLFGADDLNSQALGLLNPMEVGATPLAKAIEAVAGKLKGIRAFHGSPHDFDQFSMSKIGTGEGAQAYGHGLYFAEGEDTARYYKNALEAARRQAEPVVYNGQEIPRGTSMHRMLVDIAEKGKAATIAEMEKSIKFNASYAPDQARLTESYLDFVRNVDEAKLRVPQGRMYEVNINADPNDFLDWDAPLSPTQAQKASRALGDVRPVKLSNGYYGVTRIGPDGSGKIIQGINESSADAALARWNATFEGMSGANANTVLTGIAGDRGAVSEGLRQQGIPGIKYYDQGSRAAGQGTRNYVVFDEKLISIVKKYGIAGALGAGLINQAQARQLQEQGYQ